MCINRPLGAGLFFYECLRVLLLVICFFLVSGEGGFPGGMFFPYPVFLSSSALFSLMALFVWLRPEEYRNYLSLYMAGKIIGVVSFYAWEIFTRRWGASILPSGGYREFLGMESAAKGIILWWTSVFLNMADVLSIWGAWTLRNRRAPSPESGGI